MAYVNVLEIVQIIIYISIVLTIFGSTIIDILFLQSQMKMLKVY